MGVCPKFVGWQPGYTRLPPHNMPFSCRVLVPGCGPAPKSVIEGTSVVKYEKNCQGVRHITELQYIVSCFPWSRGRCVVWCGRRAKPGAHTTLRTLLFCTLVPSRQTRPLPHKGRPSEHREPTKRIQSSRQQQRLYPFRRGRGPPSHAFLSWTRVWACPREREGRERRASCGGRGRAQPGHGPHKTPLPPRFLVPKGRTSSLI